MKVCRSIRCSVPPRLGWRVLPRFVHESTPHSATPIPHPPTPGPPPKPPIPSASAPDERLERKRKQAELVKLGQSLRANTSQPSTVLQKRFWKNVSVRETSDGFQIMLDARAVRTPSRDTLIIPLSKPHLATAIALEWDLLVSAQQALKQHYIPLTSLTARALDIRAADAASRTNIREPIMKMLLGYLQTDTLLCWAPEKNRYEGDHDSNNTQHRGSSLRKLQMNTASPIMEFLSSRLWPGLELKPVLTEDSILPTPQPKATFERIRAWVSTLPPFELAALERGVLASKSLLVAARLLVDWSPEFAEISEHNGDRPRFTTEDAAEACSLEVSWQTGMWGEVEDTHDVDKEDIRRQLASVVLLVHSAS